MDGLGLSETEFAVVQRAVAVMMDEALAIDLEISIGADWEEFGRLRGPRGEGGVYPTFDVRHSRIAAGDGLWVRIGERSGKLVALAAGRVFRTSDFMEVLRSERLWFDRSLRALSPAFRVVDSYFGDQPWGGVVSHGGALWVAPEFRRHGLSTFVPELVRALMARNFGVDWHTSLVFERLVELARKAYGYSEAELVVDGFFPVTGTKERVYLTRMSRRELVARLEAESFTARVARLAPGRAVG